MQDSVQQRFGLFVLDEEKRALLCAGQPVPLTRKSFAILALLASRPGRIVTKDELKRAIWPDVVVEEATIAQNVFLIRKALSERMPGANFIETVAGVGYRFVEPASADNESTEAQLETPSTVLPSWSWRRLAWAFAAVLCASVLAALAWTLRRDQAVHPRSVTVLPFANLTGDSRYDYAAEGLSDALLTDMGKLSGLRVVSGRTAAHYAANSSASDLAAKLHVDAFVEGAVLMEGERLFVNVRLVQSATDRTLWTSRYSFAPHELLRIEQTISEALVGQLTPAGQGPREPHRAGTGTTSVEAYDAYLLGRFYWEKRTEADYQKAIGHFQRAIDLDPRFALAYAGLADAYALLGSMPNSVMGRHEAMERARSAARHALELDDGLAQAHTSLAFVLMHYDWDGPRAEAEFRRALQLDPNYATAHHWYAYLLMASGRPAESLREIRRAQQCDPVSPIIQTDIGELLFEDRDYAGAEREVRRALDLDPGFPLAYYWLGRIRQAQRAPASALSAYQRAYDLSGSLWALTGLAQSYAEAGDKKKAAALVARVERLCPTRSGCAGTIAPLYAEFGKRRQALQSLETAFAERDGSFIFLNQDWRFDRFRNDPRFEVMARQISHSLAPQPVNRDVAARPLARAAPTFR